MLECSPHLPSIQPVKHLPAPADLPAAAARPSPLLPRRLVNSAVHVWGSRDYETDDDSRNNMLVALLVFGDGV